MVVSSSGLLVNLYCFVADYIKIISIKGRRLRKSEKENVRYRGRGKKCVWGYSIETLERWIADV